MKCDAHGAGCFRKECGYEPPMLISSDPFRKAWLSSDIEFNLQKQGRSIDPMAPKDKFDALRIREETGRIYIGDDTEGLSKKGRAAINRYQERLKDKNPNEDI